MKSKTGFAGFDWNGSEVDLPMCDLYHPPGNRRHGSGCYWNAKMKKTTRSVFLAVGLAMLFLIMAGTLPAQDKPADNMQIVLEKIKADKKLLIAQNMQLTEAESKTFWPVYEQYQNELFLLRMRTLQLIKDYGAAYENMTNSTAKNLIDEYITIETLRLRLGETYLPKFRNALPDVKVVRYYQIENKINAILAYELAKNIPLLKTSR
ncbi:MAG: hypothetical protein A4E63_00484 [Syntrophorhabdus sp. PtaU1.Bin050]|jgi:hypothetical protein|nr:MAG: hypothetical protein A4E63_00484 [Syntrophorhabdus sp. PtaU1.Bin050]